MYTLSNGITNSFEVKITSSALASRVTVSQKPFGKVQYFLEDDSLATSSLYLNAPKKHFHVDSSSKTKGIFFLTNLDVSYYLSSYLLN